MHPRIFDMVRYAESKDCAVNLTVNGTLLNEKSALQLIDARLSLLSLSLDAASKTLYETIREGAKYRQVMRNIKYLQKIKLENKSVKPRIRSQFVITRMNLHEIDDFISLSWELGLDAAYFQPLHLEGESKKLQGMLVGDLKKEDLLAVLKKGLMHARKLNLSSNLPDLIDKFDLYWKKYHLKEQDGNRKCINPWFSGYITLDGHVVPCCMLGEYASMGNIFKDDFRAIWNNPGYRRFRERLKSGERPYEVCRHCVPLALTDIIFHMKRFAPGFVKFV
jgi:radical SAM protein with 4Fe4S-binding SPASM domain